MTDLSPSQYALVTAELSLYFDGWQQAGLPYHRPLFRAEQRWYPRDELPDGVSAGAVARHSTGSISDPTYQQAMVALYGPGKVAVWIGVRAPVEARWFREFAALLPTHLATVYRRVLIKREVIATIAPQLQMPRNVLAKHRDAVLDALIAALYAHDADESGIVAAAGIAIPDDPHARK